MEIKNIKINEVNPASYNPRDELAINNVLYRKCLDKYVDTANKRTSYFISEYGDVISINSNTKKFRFLSDKRGGKGQYIRKTLGKKECYAHRLVIEHFCNPPAKPEYNQVRHLDGNPKNNHYSNLAWGNNSLNQLDRHLHNTAAVGEKNSSSKISDIQRGTIIDMYYYQGLPPSEIVKTYKSITHIGVLNIVRNKKTLKRYGFKIDPKGAQIFKNAIYKISNLDINERIKARKNILKKYLIKE
jgi:hypothetical protein